MQKCKSILKITDKNCLKPDNSIHLNFSIEISSTDINFAWLDVAKNTFVGIECYKAAEPLSADELISELDHFFKSTPWEGKKFNSTEIIYRFHKSTLIPADFFSQKNAPTLLAINHEIYEHENIMSAKLFNLNAYNVFTLNANLDYYFNLRFSNPRANHYASSLIENLLYKQKAGQKSLVFHFQPPYIDILFFEGKKLFFFNTFHYTSKEELAHLCLFVMEQLNLSPEKVPVVIYGEIEKRSKEIELLANFINNITYGERNETFKYSYELDEIPRHFYYNLLNFHL